MPGPLPTALSSALGVLAAGPPAAEATRHAAVSRGFVLLMALCLVTVLAITAIVLWRSLRRTRRARQQAEPRRGRPLRTDAWREAGRRARPIDPDPDLPDDADRLGPD